ncbi:MAG: hypothetical protein ABIJ84_04640 [bacterium]
MQHKTERQAPLSATVAKQVLLLIDWDNLFFGLFHLFGAEEMRIENRIKRLMEWVDKEVGKLLGGFGFVFAPEHLSFLHQQICVKNGLKLIICPKKQLKEPKLNQKTGDLEAEEDTVDETIIWFAKTMIRHPNFRFICLVSGDNDYVPLFREMARHGVKRALVAPTTDSLAKSKELVNLVDKHPRTLKKMSFRLDYV